MQKNPTPLRVREKKGLLNLYCLKLLVLEDNISTIYQSLLLIKHYLNTLNLL